MTLGKEVEQDVKDTQKRQQQPFQIVLVDIKKAAENEVIHCVKTPLVVEEGKTEALKYIALSYRWGELQETLVDTKVGYIATLTSFSLNDFYQLCRMMTIESDTKHIQYVWVDAICVDQSHYRRRKETIYQMSNIYERASYILAIPDLHLTFLKGTSMKINDLLKQSMHLIKDLYYLLHGNVDKMAAIETTFLDELNVPKDPALRQLLTQWTDHFVTGFMNYKKHHVGYIDAKALDHIYETSGTAKTNNMDNYSELDAADAVDDSNDSNDSDDNDDGDDDGDDDDQAEEDMTTAEKAGSFENLHHCTLVDCPLELFNDKELGWHDWGESEWSLLYDRQWQQRIVARSTTIRQSMEFLVDLVNDWSSRVWVISEFSIAKKKNNLKYWFTQLAPYRFHTDTYKVMDDAFSFFKFDFDDPSFASILNSDIYLTESNTYITRKSSSNPVYIQFHYTMIRQLKQQSFLEMMLSSKASKNEDRFYSILPLSEYKTELVCSHAEVVEQWHIHTLLSVKMQLYKIMNTKDKLNLLYWSADPSASTKTNIQPTFATSTLRFSDVHAEYVTRDNVDFSCNFDLIDPSTIMLHLSSDQHHTDTEEEEEEDGKHGSYLTLKPIEYYVDYHFRWTRAHVGDTLCKTQDFYQQFDIVPEDVNDDPRPGLDFVRIPAFSYQAIEATPHLVWDFHTLCLIGSFKHNKWLVTDAYRYERIDSDFGWIHNGRHKAANDYTSFHIY